MVSFLTATFTSEIILSLFAIAVIIYLHIISLKSELLLLPTTELATTEIIKRHEYNSMRFFFSFFVLVSLLVVYSLLFTFDVFFYSSLILGGCITGILLVFWQNVAKIMIKCLPLHKKCSWNIRRKLSSEFSKGKQTIISFSMIFARYKHKT